MWVLLVKWVGKVCRCSGGGTPKINMASWPFLGLRDWSLITGRGGYKTGQGPREVLPLQNRGGGRTSFSHAEGGAQQVLG